MKSLSNLMVILLGGTFLSAQTRAADINVGYLNSLTGPKVSWSESEGTEVTIGDKTFYYTYNKPDNYEQTTTRVNNTAPSQNLDSKLFYGISGNQGGAIYSKSDNTADVTINSDFVGNHATSGGGAIYMYAPSSIRNISGTFVGNYARGGTPVGGAIYTTRPSSVGTYIESLTGNFVGNWVEGTGDGSFMHAGAVDNHGTLNYLEANFIGNYGKSSGKPMYGGALHNGSANDGKIGLLKGNFVGNGIDVGSAAGLGGALASSGKIDSIEDTNFYYNYVNSATNARGGAIYTSDNIGNMSNLVFDNNFVTSDDAAYGGAIYSQSSIGNIVNSQFTNNSVQAPNGNGGAIYSTSNLNITADDGTSLFEGNTVNGESNAIYMAGTSDSKLDLNLTGTNNGAITFNDNIDGQYYNINVLGSNEGEVGFFKTVGNFDNLAISEEAIMHMGVNSAINGKSMVFTSTEGYTGSSKPSVKVDIEVDKNAQETNSGLITLTENVSGDYDVIVNSLNPDIYDGAYTAFLYAPNDTDSSDENFEVSRVIGSPYMWKAFLNYLDEEEGSTWYLALTDEENPDFPKPEPEPEPQPKPSKIYAPEVIAGIGLHEAAIEQTRSVVHNVKGKVAAGREFCPRCGMYDYGWDNNLLRNIWVLAQGESANIEEPVDMDAKIWGIEAGFDVQNDIHNTLGVFASYSNGEYDLSGKGKKFRSNIGSEINIDSYLAGLYYRYDRYLVWAFATIYGGIQQAEIETDDGIAKFDTDGIEFGASIEIGRTIPLTRDLMLDPSVGLYYTQVNFDDTDDSVGKHYEWDDIKHLEAELGAKLEKQFDNAKVYVKPSVIRTLTKDDSVLITGLNKADTYSDQTLGCIEVGGRYGFTDALSIYAWANYTFGSSYDAYALGAGLNYAW